jgi:hypothetical protein
MYLAHELKATSSFSRSPNVVLLNTASQYKNWGTISDVTSFLRVSIGVKCSIDHNLFNVKITFRQILFISMSNFGLSSDPDSLPPTFICGLAIVQDVFGLTTNACDFDELMDSLLAIVHMWIRLRSSFKRAIQSEKSAGRQLI